MLCVKYQFRGLKVHLFCLTCLLNGGLCDVLYSSNAWPDTTTCLRKRPSQNCMQHCRDAPTHRMHLIFKNVVVPKPSVTSGNMGDTDRIGGEISVDVKHYDCLLRFWHSAPILRFRQQPEMVCWMCCEALLWIVWAAPIPAGQPHAHLLGQTIRGAHHPGPPQPCR